MNTSNTTFDLILKNANFITYSEKDNKMIEQIADIGVTNGKIVAIENSLNQPALKVLNVKHLAVLPGIIDSQVHFREPGMTHKEDIESGSRAALLGGVTTFFEMPNTNPPTTTKELFQQKLNLSQNRSHSHYAYFIGGSSDNISELPQLEKLPHCSGIKIFLGSSFGNLLIDQDDVFEKIMQSGTRRVVIHSEDESRLKQRKHIAIESGHPKAHPIWRDEESALITTKKSVHFAQKYKRPIHILHISSSEEMAYLSEQKKNSQNPQQLISVEILPQYLTLSSPECYERLGTLAQQNPPIRDKKHLEHLWKAVLNGTVDVIGSDHAPHTLEDKQKPYPQSPSGVPGVQTLVPLMLDQVTQKKLPLSKFVELVTENPRKIFNLKNKGRIQIGFDADFTIVDLQKTQSVQKSWLASKTGWSPFEGMNFTGWPVFTILNGEVCVEENTIVNPHQGQACEFSIS
ncbi:MAG: dihydroorotase [Pseudobdellovibrio sp.]